MKRQDLITLSKIATNKLTEIGKYTVQAHDILESNVRNFAKHVNEIQVVAGKGLANILDNVSIYMKVYAEEVSTVEEILSLAGYPPMFMIDTDLKNEILQLLEQNGQESVINNIDSIMTNYYSDDKLDEVLDDIMSLESKSLIGRWKFIDQVFYAHKQELFAVTVPPLATQLEGIIVSAYGVTGDVSTKELKDLVSNLLSRDSLGGNDSAEKFYREYILVGFEHGRKSKSLISRHGIAHGGTLPDEFANEASSLKLILILQYILIRIELLDPEEASSARKEILKSQAKRKRNNNGNRRKVNR